MLKTADIIKGTTGALRLAAALLSVSAAPLCTLAQTTDLLPAAPIDHFRLYGFDKDNGWRSWQLEGARAEIGTDGSAKVIDMRLQIFEASEKQVVNMTIVSPIAQMPKTRDRIEGGDTIIMTAKGVYLSGSDWSWQPDLHRLFIRYKTHTVIEGEVGPILE
jgi:hypothetical protein